MTARLPESGSINASVDRSDDTGQIAYWCTKRSEYERRYSLIWFADLPEKCLVQN
jgi:hypothetical protein